MAYCRLEDTFVDHAKFRKLAKRLGVSAVTARGHVAMLWSWALRYAPDGGLGDRDPEDIELAVEWDGDCGAFVAACVDVGVIDRVDDGLEIHEYYERNESLKSAQRMRASRERKRDERLQDVTQPCATVPKSSAEQSRAEQSGAKQSGAEPSSWKAGDDIGTLGDLAVALSAAGLSVVVSSGAQRRFSDIRPIPHHEWAEAAEKTKAKNPRKAAEYALGVILGIREDHHEKKSAPPTPKPKTPTAYQPWSPPSEPL